MGRIPDQDRLAVVDGHLGHWAQADAENGMPIEILPGYGRTQLQADRDAYHALQEDIAQKEGDLQFNRAQRDDVFGTGGDDEDGVWFRLKQYKAMVRVRLGPRHPLGRTVPNLGRISARDYTTILHRFIDHWERVNAELEPDMTLGPFALTDLQAAHDSLLSLHQQIESLEEGELPLLRARREQTFGDVSDEERDETSIIARLMLYHAVIEATFAGQPLADSLPEIFPGSGGTPSLPTFRFNWAETGASEIELWFEMIDGLTGTDTLFIREGAEEFFTAASPMPGEVFKTPWSGVIIVDEVDEVTLRNGQGIDIARGVRDQTLADPGP